MKTDISRAGKSAAMRRVGNRQWSLKPQDLVVLLKLVTLRGVARLSYAALAKQLCLSVFEAHAAVQRLGAARLVVEMEGELRPVMVAVRDFVLHGAQYSFPAARGEIAIGFPTAYAVQPLKEMVLFAEEMPPVWPHPDGSTRGATLFPLYEKLPMAAIEDPVLYELLALFDALRVGQAREREIASKLLEERLQ
jgi:hypothetical protein